MKPVEIEFFIDNKTKPGVNEMISGFDKTADRADALQKKIAMVEKQLSDLQQQAEKGIDIGAAGTESVDVLRNKLAKLQEELKNVNKTAVSTKMIPPEIGAVKTKFNGLNMSIQQIARELPSLAMGPQMFFLAISNNLPVFTDQLALARKEFQAMTAAGKEAVPVWKQVLSSIVSWQTALAVGITLSVTYGKEIGNWVKSIFSGKSALDDFSESMKDFNSEVIKQQRNATILFDTLRKTSEGTEQRRKAIEQINDAYGKYLPYLLNEKSTLDEIYEAYKSVNSAILENAALKAQQKEIDESTESSISKQTKIIDTLRKNLKGIATNLSEEDINNYVLSIRKSIENYLSKGFKSNEAAAKVLSDLLPDKRFLSPREADFSETLKKYSYEIAKYYATINSVRQKYDPFLNNTTAGTPSTATEEIDRLTSRISTLKKEIAELRNGTVSAGAGQTVDKAIAAKENEIRQAEESLRRLTGISASDKKEADKDAEYLLKTNKEVQQKIADNNIALIKDRYEREREAAWVEFQREKNRIQEEEKERLALYNKLRKNGADISPEQELDIIANAIVQNMQAKQLYVQTLNKINREEEEEAKKKYDKLLATYRDYVDKRIAINTKYDEDIAALEAGKNESNAVQVERSIVEANRMRQKELENIDREISRTAVEGSKILQNLFSRAAVQSKKEIEIAISDAEKLLRLLKGESISGNLGFTDEQISAMKKDGALIEKILQGIIAKKEQLYAKKGTFSRFAADLKELRNALSMEGGDKKTDRINSALKSTLSIAQEIGQAFGDVAGRLSQIAELSGDSGFQEIADVLSNTSAFFNSAVSGAVSGMQLGGVGGAIAGGILSGGLSLLSMAFESSARHKAALKEVQQAEIAYQRQYNLLLLEQNMLLKEANTIFGTDKIKGAIQMVRNYGEALKDLKKALQGEKPEEVIFGKGDFSNYAQQLRDYRTGIDALNKKEAASQKDGSQKSVWETVIVRPSGSALKQQQEQLNKQAADAQNQRLSAYQKQMEAYNAGIGALSKVDIVTGHKKTGLFGWGRGRDVYTNILDMKEYKDLILENGRLDKLMLQSILNTRKMTDESRATLENLLEIENQLDEAEEQLSNYLSDTFGVLGKGIMDSVTSALNGSKNALQNFADDAAGVLENLGEQIAYSLYFAAAFEDLQRQLKELYMSEDDEKVIGKKAQDLIGDFYAGIGGQIESATAWLEEWKKQAAEKGFNLWPSDTASQKGQAGAFQTLTQDQGTKLEGLFTALQMHAAAIDMKLDNAAAGLASALAVLQEIKVNTDSIPSIYRELQIIKRDGVKFR